MFSTCFTSLCLTSSSTIDHLLRLCARFLILFHLTQIRFPRSVLLLMCFSLETLTSIMRTGLPVLVELIDLMNSIRIFLCQTAIRRWLTFLLAFLAVVLTVLLFWIYVFFSSDASICSTMAFPPLGNSDHGVVSVSIDFPSYSQRDSNQRKFLKFKMPLPQNQRRSNGVVSHWSNDMEQNP